jgi:hypothetical protein
MRRREVAARVRKGGAMATVSLVQGNGKGKVSLDTVLNQNVAPA